MILLGEVIEPLASPEFYSFFLVAIQLGSALAVAAAYFSHLNPWGREKTHTERKATLRLLACIALGCIPVAIIGFFADDLIFRYCYRTEVVAAMLLFYGVAFVWIERRKSGRDNRICSASEIGAKKALAIGAFQILSLIPGTSRSGATILGARLIGIDRAAAAEFSFFLSLPVMLGASLLEGMRFVSRGGTWMLSEILLLLVGGCVAFLTSLCVIRFLLQYVKKHSFAVFGWYRITLGLLLLLISCT